MMKYIKQKKESFIFSKENQIKITNILQRYPQSKKQSAVMPLLYLAQEQNNGWLTINSMDHIAEILKIPVIRIYELANFYTMYHTKPIGKYLVQVCHTTPCWLNGSDDIASACCETLGINIGESTEDGLFTLAEVECLGACINSPVMQINLDYYENLNKEKVVLILNKLRNAT